MSTTDPGRICDPPFTCTDLTKICHRANSTADLGELCHKSYNLPNPLIPALPSYESTGLPASCTFRPMTSGSNSISSSASPLDLALVVTANPDSGLAPPTEFLFISAADSSLNLISAADSGYAPTLAITASGLSPSAYAGHSFCCGATTWAASLGANCLGRWNSNCFQRYINCSAANHQDLTITALYHLWDSQLIPTPPLDTLLVLPKLLMLAPSLLRPLSAVQAAQHSAGRLGAFEPASHFADLQSNRTSVSFCVLSN
ncbi:uncharacterized protein UDID_19214 [Ustilago sp. UG-2017a]|nr:uncharacterized protein UDID_19214 [Ustilago sp. UG-2017a]